MGSEFEIQRAAVQVRGADSGRRRTRETKRLKLDKTNLRKTFQLAGMRAAGLYNRRSLADCRGFVLGGTVDFL